MSFTLQNGYLKIPGHQGEFPSYKLERRWPLSRRTELTDGNISFETGKNKLSISTRDLINKLKLTNEEIDFIREEPNPSQRSIMLRNIVSFKNNIEKQERGSLLLSLFSSPIHGDLRANHPETFLEEIQKVLDTGPISLAFLVKSFEHLLKEEFSENFFVLGNKLLEKICLEEDKTLLQNGLDKIREVLENISSENTLSQDLRFSLMLNSIYRAHNEISVAIESSVARAESEDPIQKTSLRWLGSDQAISDYLELETWETYGDKAEACKRLIASFRTRRVKLDLSNLNLTSLPFSLKKMPWITDLDVSKNMIQELSPISGLKRLRALDLSFNLIGGNKGIANFQALDKLELLQSVKLLYLRGNPRILEDRLRVDLKNCDHIEWTDDWANHRIFSKRPRELLRDFWQRREQEFRRLPETLESFSQMSLSDTPREPIIVLDNPEAPEVLANHPLALQRLGLTELDITPLIKKDPNIISWLHRLAIEEGFKGFTKDADTLAMLAEKVPEIMQYALENEEFFEKVLKYSLFQSAIHCGDRTVYYFNEIVRKMELFKAIGAPLEDALPIFRKYFSIALIKQEAERSIKERTQEMSLEEKKELENESLEVELDFLLRFKELFKEEFTVPLALAKGVFTSTGKETREDFLIGAAQRIRDSLASPKDWIQYLATDSEWRKYLLSYRPEMQSPLEQEEQTFREIGMDELNSLELNSAELIKKFDELKQKDHKNTADFLAKITEQVLTEQGLLA